MGPRLLVPYTVDDSSCVILGIKGIAKNHIIDFGVWVGCVHFDGRRLNWYTTWAVV
jgi:hypothetical protein